MDESTLTSKLVRDFNTGLPGCVVFKHFDVATNGMPDLSVTWARCTLWVEVKYCKGKTRATQIVTMKRLWQAGLAYYVCFDFNENEPFTSITQGNLLGERVLFEGHGTHRVVDFFKNKMRKEQYDPHRI